MKKLVRLSGIITVLLLPLLLTGWADADDAVKNTLRQGNGHYATARYEEALTSYETGLGASPENKALNFNAAQAAYMLREYEKAIQYYGKSEDSIEKFLNSGNASFRLGDASSDANQKMQYYTQALQTYKDGIMKYPRNVPLKYNYEMVKEKIEELLENMEQESDDQNDGESDGQNDGESDGQSKGGDNQEQESKNTENAKGEQEQNSEQGENSGGNQGESQNREDGQQESYSQNEGGNMPDQEAIARILEMLENQEKESLKNNQGVVGGKDGKNGW